MPFDAHKNLAIATVVTAPSPAASGTSLVVGAGQGARFPAVPFNGTVWPFDMAPDPATAEVWRCTAIAGDTLTLVRAQEGTTARAMVAGDLIAATITAKSLTDIESGVNFPQLASAGDLVFSGAAVTKFIRTATTDGADNQAIYITPAGTIGDDRGARLSLQGNETAAGGNISLVAGNTATGKIEFYTGASAVRGAMHPSGGFSWGSTTDPGAGNLSVNGQIHFTSAIGLLRPDTQDGADTKLIQICGGGDPTGSRGAFINVQGNENASPGQLDLVAGNVAQGSINFYSGPTTLRGKIHPSGGFSWGGTTDPGAGSILVGAASGQGQNFVQLNPGTMSQGRSEVTTVYFNAFYNANGNIGAITGAGSGVAFVTTSDARLKTPLSRHTDTAVLRDTIIHKFVWKADGQPGRGVFAQEAAVVAPFAVSVGGDEVDDQGRLVKPWGVDYAKYVPDLIVGWQQQQSRLDDLQGQLATLRASLGTLRTDQASSLSAHPSWVGQIYQRVCVWLSAWWAPVEITP